ncbi:MAG: TraR/DksA family transcriptional regulator [Propionibacteriaceae bacterium]
MAPAKKSTQAIDLPTAAGEKSWTAEEITEVREELEQDISRITKQIQAADAELTQLLHEGSDGAGRDTADVGSSNFERDTEMTLTTNLRDMLDQCQHALARLNAGAYGNCESCGEPIGKGRLMAFPRATMCVSCKTREERR